MVLNLATSIRIYVLMDSHPNRKANTFVTSDITHRCLREWTDRQTCCSVIGWWRRNKSPRGCSWNMYSLLKLPPLLVLLSTGFHVFSVSLLISLLAHFPYNSHSTPLSLGAFLG